jgi:tRNA(fMet)-specific endonuclease VapC
MYLLDTHIVGYWMRGHLQLIEKIRDYSPADLALSTITMAEIYYGIEKSSTKKRERRAKIDHICSQLEIFPFIESTAEKYGLIRAGLERKGLVISERDLQIGAIAMANRLRLVTHNTKEFTRIQGLKVEEWAQ